MMNMSIFDPNSFLPHWIEDVEFFLGGTGALESLTMKYANTCVLATDHPLQLISSYPNSTSYFVNHPNTSCFCNTCLSEKLVNKTIPWLWKQGKSFLRCYYLGYLFHIWIFRLAPSKALLTKYTGTITTSHSLLKNYSKLLWILSR